MVMMVMVPKGIFATMTISLCPARRRLYRAAPDRPCHHDCATAAPRVSPRCPRRKNGADAEFGERDARKGALPGTAYSLPGVAETRKNVEIPARVPGQTHLFAVVRTAVLL